MTYLSDPTQAYTVEGVLHIGACSSTTETNEEYLRRNNIEYSQHLFEFCARKKKPLIYASSAATYGDGKLGFDDTHPASQFTPLNLYGWSKLKFDLWADQQTQTPPRWYGLRYFNVYGPNEYHKGDQASVVLKAHRQIRQTGKLKLFRSLNPMYADGEQLRDFVYIKDITRWMYELMNTSKAKSGIYNMGFGKARTWLDLARATFTSLNREAQIDWIDMPDNLKNQYQYFTEAKMDRWLAQGLSRPQWTLEEGVNDYVRNYLEHEDRCL